MHPKSRTCFNKKNGEPLSIYFSEKEAAAGACYVKQEYGSDLLPYKCSMCGHWHLSPKDRYTPGKECMYCTNSNGSYKELYETKEFAEKRAKILKDERGKNLKVYKCPYRKGWHLTKN